MNSLLEIIHVKQENAFQHSSFHQSWCLFIAFCFARKQCTRRNSKHTNSRKEALKRKAYRSKNALALGKRHVFTPFFASKKFWAVNTWNSAHWITLFTFTNASPVDGCSTPVPPRDAGPADGGTGTAEQRALFRGHTLPISTNPFAPLLGESGTMYHDYLYISWLRILYVQRHAFNKELMCWFQVWEDEKGELLRSLVANGGTARVAGDSRADSPGYSAKYGVYTLLETSINRIINIQLVQVRVQ